MLVGLKSLYEMATIEGTFEKSSSLKVCVVVAFVNNFVIYKAKPRYIYPRRLLRSPRGSCELLKVAAEG